MSRKVLLGIFVLIVVTMISIPFIANRSESAVQLTKVDPAFSGYVAAYTSGVISNESYIRVMLAEEYSGAITINEAVQEQYFSFSPAIPGKAYWIDTRTIEFRPDKRLASDQLFEVDFALGKLVSSLPDNLKHMKFSFRTMKQSMNYQLEGTKTTDKKSLRWQQLRGTIITADAADNTAVEQTFSATQNGKKLPVRWEHLTDHATHKFTVDSIARTDKAGSFTIEVDGKPIGVNFKESKKVDVPSLKEFKVLDIRVEQGQEQCVVVQFSDPIMEKQDLNGLIDIEKSNSDYRYTIEDNDVRVYPSEHLTGSYSVSVSPGVKNILGYSLAKKQTQKVVFEDLKPDLKLVGNGIILPNTDKGLLFPFQVVNLNAVDVKIIRIFENNIPQFLQTNSLSGSNELYRVGKVVLKKKVDLNIKSKNEYGKWTTYSLDLGQLIAAEPGAIYRVSISFRKEYSMYNCPKDTLNNGDEESQYNAPRQEEDFDPELDDGEYGYYGGDYYDNYYWYWEGDHDRDDPCSNTYYYSHSITRNVLASDLGLMAKRGNDGSMLFAVNDIKTTMPLSNIDLELYSYQNQLITSFKSDAHGMAEIDMPKKKPFLLVAKSGTQRGYLKLDDGSALSVSAFDVGGLETQKGIKGMIYGERGVWRPGDTLFLSFILEDKMHVLPPAHPVTMELYNSRGQLVNRSIKSTSVNGFYTFTSPTDADAPTGYWTAKVQVGGATFTKNLKVETIMPNRLKINMDFGADGIGSKDDQKINLESKWLVGAPAKNLRTMVDVSLHESDTKFKGFDNYEFDDPASDFYTESKTIFQGRLDENGKTSFTAELHGKGAPGKLKASFNTRVFEESGAFSIDYFTSEYSPYSHYVGVYTPQGNGWGGTLYTGTNYTILTQSVDESGKVAQRNDLQVKVYKMSWRWWWSSGYNDMAYYVNSNYYEPVLDTVINSDAKGKGTFNLKVADNDYGRYLIRITDKSGHSTGKVVWFDWPYWDGTSTRTNEAASLLQVSSDKKAYAVGENINLTIPSPGQGRALITIENGAGVLGHYWVESKTKGNLSYSIPVTSEMAPNVYIGVTLLQPHAQTVNDAPIRMYGVIPVVVDDPKTHLSPVITTAAAWAPETVANVTVSESAGKPMTYTLAIVDEGLLDLTRFKTPDPWNTFYSREALGVKTWDMYDLVMGAYGAELERVLGIGGDGDATKNGTQKANRFKPMVKFLGPFELKPGEKKNHAVMMPQYVGSVRVMVVAGQDAAYGNAEKAVPVRKPLMILGTLPRVVGPGETVDLPVNIFAMEKKVKDVSVTVSTNEMFTVAGGSTKSVSFKDVGEEVLTYRLNVAQAAGIGTVKIVATGGGERAVYEIEIDVRNPNPRMTEAKEAIIDPGKSWTTDYYPVGIQGTNSGVLEISSIPPLNLGERLKYLISYPHGCVEQTTSAAFPQLFLDDVVDLDDRKRATIKENITVAVKHLRDFQTTSGGIAYWPGDQYPSEWGTNYAGHFLLEAEARGYTLPAGMMEKWKSFQKEQAMNWSPRYDRYYYRNDDLIQAYRLYTLALAKAPELGAMNRLREVKTLSVQAKWRLAAAYHLAGQPEIAQQLVTGLATTISPYAEYSYSYGSGDRDEAMILETLSLMGGDWRTKGAPVAKALSDRLNRTYYYMNTQATAYCLLALCKFSAGDPGQTGVQAEYTIDGKGGKLDTKESVTQTDMKVTTTNSGKVTVKNNGKGVLYVRVVLAGVPEAGNEKEAQSNLLMNVRYYSMNGKDLDPKQVTQGTDFVAQVTISNPGLRGEYRDMALTQIFPSGWEIRNQRMMAGPGDPIAKSDYFDFQDIRDDRVMTYFYIGSNGSRTYRVQLHATYTGHFYLPSVYCESMYDNAVNARKLGMWVDVVQETFN